MPSVFGNSLPPLLFGNGRRFDVIKESVIPKYQTAASLLSLGEHEGKKESILVVSPHPDDDVLGAGGTMALTAEQGRGVFSVCVTDGRGSPRNDPRITDEEMARGREKEALTSLRAIGAAGGFFLRKQSQDLKGDRGVGVREELEAIFQILQPTEVYLPAPYERHRTHQLCTALTLEALRASVDWPIQVFGYSLWGCFWGGKRKVVRDIGSVIRRKMAAVLAHASQIDYKNYHQGILGKNNYEAVFLECHEVQKSLYVEIFLDLGEFLSRKDLSIRAFIREDMENFQDSYLTVS
jgi:N-acetylglucosamine malate deacetylase 1